MTRNVRKVREEKRKVAILLAKKPRDKVSRRSPVSDDQGRGRGDSDRGGRKWRNGMKGGLERLLDISPNKPGGGGKRERARSRE